MITADKTTCPLIGGPAGGRTASLVEPLAAHYSYAPPGQIPTIYQLFSYDLPRHTAHYLSPLGMTDTDRLIAAAALFTGPGNRSLFQFKEPAAAAGVPSTR